MELIVKRTNIAVGLDWMQEAGVGSRSIAKERFAGPCRDLQRVCNNVIGQFK